MEIGEYRVTCLVDNTAQLSSGFWAEHGSAFLIESADAKVLFDTGQSGDVLLHNLAVLNEDLSNLSSIVLSHGHYDHTGGLERVLSLCGDVELVAHPATFDERISRDKSGKEKAVGIPLSREYLEARCKLRLTTEPVQVAPGIFTTGQVERGTGPEPRDPRLQVRTGGHSVVDPLLDDMSLVLESSSGLVVLLGCCHAGIINTLEQVTTNFSGVILAVLGGTHLANVENDVLLDVVAVVKEQYGVQSVYAGHCSGYRGLLAFAEVYGERARPCHAGLRLTF
jgi:7,8-dihydropterin-6-yl-methyl-4-(beta-D-ribofuranosyl)aminobenzene 5'-phosphate synthase